MFSSCGLCLGWGGLWRLGAGLCSPGRVFSGKEEHDVLRTSDLEKTLNYWDSGILMGNSAWAGGYVLRTFLYPVSRLESRAAFWPWTSNVLTWQQLRSVCFLYFPLLVTSAAASCSINCGCSAVSEGQSCKRKYLMKRANNPHCGVEFYSRITPKYPLMVGLY